jgi:hypothetical protein
MSQQSEGIVVIVGLRSATAFQCVKEGYLVVTGTSGAHVPQVMRIHEYRCCPITILQHAGLPRLCECRSKDKV